LLCTSTEDYPVFPVVEEGNRFEIEALMLRDLIKHTIFSVSFDETKQFLNGILFKCEDSVLHLISTDGYRLALKKGTVPAGIQNFEAIVPFKALNELLKVLLPLAPETKVSVTLSDNQVSFHFGDFLLVSRVINGQFPDYKQVVPESTEHRFSVRRKDFLDACERASIIALSSNNVVRLTFDEGKLTIRSSAAALGDFREDLSLARETGEGSVSVAFNVKLILDAIKILESEEIVLAFNNGLAPCVIQSKLDDDFNYIIMPIRTSDFQQES
jgi:DNA polymerase-3 subunit beta